MTRSEILDQIRVAMKYLSTRNFNSYEPQPDTISASQVLGRLEGRLEAEIASESDGPFFSGTFQFKRALSPSDGEKVAS